jgi:Asp-tRNA(Asn)/Glu-tRNA(Gln) amidotransferase A subunit family amidase
LLIPGNFYFQGVPSISIPYSKCSRGLPLGVQLVGPYLEDERLLEMAKFLKTPTNGTEESE